MLTAGQWGNERDCGGGIAVAKRDRMYPLLVNAVAATASNLIDRWAQSRAMRETKPALSFQQVLNGAASAKNSPTATIERLRADLLSSPEVRTAVDSGDPTRPVALQLSADGTVSAQSPGQNARALSLSPETATLARSLAALLPASSAL